MGRKSVNRLRTDSELSCTYCG